MFSLPKFSFKKYFNLDILIGIVFFTLAGLIFFLYTIDYSPLIVAAILLFYSIRFKKITFLSAVDLSLLGGIAILVALLPLVTFKLSGYYIPAIAFSLLITLLFGNLELSLLFSLFISFLSASVDGGNFNICVSLFSGSVVAALFSYRIRKRTLLIRAGLVAGVVEAVAAFLIEQQSNLGAISTFNIELIKAPLLVGFLSSVVVLGVLPLFEYMFRVVTDISLLELSDFNHPVMRKLILEAPGTYQHSLVVANLSESAAEAIGADSLLARVGAYYHDIGKMLKPHYFIENQSPRKNVHRDLKPSMSKLIIVNHVKEGIELARKYHLNPRIVDFITQHHGKTLVYYFYQRAKEMEPHQQEEEYRYPGPRPQSKETAIVALADTIEAFSRTLEEPSPSRIEELVREVVRKRFLEGELDESGLTLSDLEKITQSFIRILNAIFHVRINYPKDEDKNKQSTKNSKDKHKRT